MLNLRIFYKEDDFSKLNIIKQLILMNYLSIVQFDLFQYIFSY